MLHIFVPIVKAYVIQGDKRQDATSNSNKEDEASLLYKDLDEGNINI